MYINRVWNFLSEYNSNSLDFEWYSPSYHDSFGPRVSACSGLTQTVDCPKVGAFLRAISTRSDPLIPLVEQSTTFTFIRGVFFDDVVTVNVDDDEWIRYFDRCWLDGRTPPQWRLTFFIFSAQSDPLTRRVSLDHIKVNEMKGSMILTRGFV